MTFCGLSAIRRAKHRVRLARCTSLTLLNPAKGIPDPETGLALQ
jgi:hypothetical protein